MLQAELKALRENYRTLGCRASLRAIERDTAFQALRNTRAYVTFLCPDCLAEHGRTDRDAPVSGKPAGPMPGTGAKLEQEHCRHSEATSRRRVLDALKACLTPHNRLLETEVRAARQEKATLSRAVQELGERLDGLTLQRDAACRSLDELSRIAETYPLQDAAMQTLRETLSEDAARLVSVSETLSRTRLEKNDLLIQLAESQDSVAGLLRNEQRLRDEIDGLDRRLSDADKEKAGAQRRVQELVDELDRQRQARQLADSDHRDQLDALHRRIAGLQGEIDTTREQTALLRASFTETQSERDTAREHLSQLDLLLRESQSALAERETRLAEVGAEAQRLQVATNAAGRKLSDAEQACRISEEKVQFLSVELNKIRADREQAGLVDRRRIENLQHKVDELGAALADANRTIENLELSLAAAACREEIQDKHSAALEQALARFRSESTQTPDAVAVAPAAPSVTSRQVSDERLAGHANWKKFATGFVVLVGLLASLAKLREIDTRELPRIEYSSQSEQIAGVTDLAGRVKPALSGVAATPEITEVPDAAGDRPGAPAPATDSAAATQQQALPSRTEMAMVNVFGSLKPTAKQRGGVPTVYAYLSDSPGSARERFDSCLKAGATERECTFLESNMLEEGIIRLPSGVQYRVMKNGTGASPGPDDIVQVDFRGLLLDGTEFDSSDRRGAVSRFRVDEAIPGLQDVLQAMEEGGKWLVYVPTELAFRQPAPFSGQTVVFEIELLAIEGGQVRAPVSLPADAAPASPPPAAQLYDEVSDPATEDVPDDRQTAADDRPLWEQVEARTRQFLAANARRQGVITLPSGLQYRVLARGDGRGQVPRETDSVVLHYRGTFPDGTEFESSRSEGDPVTFSMQEVTPGWKEALLQMQVGDSWELYVPPALAQDSETRLLGTRGQQALVYEIELLGIR